MKNVINFLLVFFACPLMSDGEYKEQYRVHDGTVFVDRNENRIQFEYEPDNYSECSHVTYIYYLRGDSRNFKELRIHQINRPMIIITTDASNEMIRVYTAGIEDCYCAPRQCEASCRIGSALFYLWTDKLEIRRHLLDPSHVVIF